MTTLNSITKPNASLKNYMATLEFNPAGLVSPLTVTQLSNVSLVTNPSDDAMNMVSMLVLAEKPVTLLFMNVSTGSNQSISNTTTALPLDTSMKVLTLALVLKNSKPSPLELLIYSSLLILK